jgi:hypothetical protein
MATADGGGRRKEWFFSLSCLDWQLQTAGHGGGELVSGDRVSLRPSLRASSFHSSPHKNYCFYVFFFLQSVLFML